MVGDSVMFAYWKQLMCSLNTPDSGGMHADVQWAYYQGGSNEMKTPYYNWKTCPMREKHCHIDVMTWEKGVVPAVAYFPRYDAKISFIWKNEHHSELLEDVSRGLTKKDIIILNFGLHFNNRNQYTENMKVFTADVRNFSRMRPVDSKPALFFLETSPQHFDPQGSEHHGYFVSKEYLTTNCWYEIIDEELHAREYDWRNIVANEYLRKDEEISSALNVIHIARTLYSQWDAHVAGDSKEMNLLTSYFELADCTHWLAPSGIYHYIFTKIYNAIIQFDNGE
jgi:hypothetical protein